MTSLNIFLTTSSLVTFRWTFFTAYTAASSLFLALIMVNNYHIWRLMSTISLFWLYLNKILSKCEYWRISISLVVVVYHVTIVAIGHGLLKKFWPFGTRLRSARNSIIWNYADPLTSLIYVVNSNNNRVFESWVLEGFPNHTEEFFG